MPGKLILSLNSAVLGEFPLDQDRIVVGRRPDNDIQIDNLAVSGRHAAIITILNDSFLEDLDSTNGTFVNGKLIKKHALRHSDVIGIGKHELRYVNEDAADEDDFEKTMIVRPGAASHSAAAARAAEAPEAAEAEAAANGTGKIRVLNGPATGKELELLKSIITLGRPGIQVAVITRRPQGYYVTHVEGGHPMVNGRSIGTLAHALKQDDVIEIAGIRMRFTLEG